MSPDSPHDPSRQGLPDNPGGEAGRGLFTPLPHPLRTLRRALAGALSGVVQTLLQSLRVGVFAFSFYAIFFNLSVVRGSSMTPGIEDGDRILDTCAAPGTKTTGIAERLGDSGRILALDRHPPRLALPQHHPHLQQVPSLDWKHP